MGAIYSIIGIGIILLAFSTAGLAVVMIFGGVMLGFRPGERLGIIALIALSASLSWAAIELVMGAA